MKTAAILLFSMALSVAAHAQTSCPGGVCPLPPKQIYVPQTKMVPMQLQQMQWVQVRYGLFGWQTRWVLRPVYAPMAPQAPVRQEAVSVQRYR